MLARQWAWLSFFAGMPVGLVGCVILALVLDLILSRGGLRFWFFAAFVTLLATFAACNIMLERK